MMNRHQNELQFLGSLGVYRETSEIIVKCRKIFARITLTLILPLCIILLAHSLVSQLLFYKILNDEITLNDIIYKILNDEITLKDIIYKILKNEITLIDTWKDDPEYRDLSRMLQKEWGAFGLVRLSYFFLVFIFSPLSTAAVVYTVASVYAAKQITFKKIMSVVPRVWKRLMVTFFWCFALFFEYNAVAVGLLIVWLITVRQFSVGPALGIALAVILLILYVVGFVYITMICQLASVISVLEDAYGRKAMLKSKGLIKGKMGLPVWCFLGVLVFSVLVQALFESLVVLDLVPNGVRIGVGLVCLLSLSMLVLFDLVVQTVIYFVCKSYHHENIDSSFLSDHLEGCLGDCGP